MKVLIGAITLLTLLTSECFAQNFVGIEGRTLERFEQIRKELAIEWFEAEAPEWKKPVRVFLNSGAPGGATRYSFSQNWVIPSTMVISGRDWTSIENTAKHEIFHLLLAEWVGQGIPRWVDEGLASHVEEQDVLWNKKLYEYLQTGRGIPLNHMFSVASSQPYPRDTLPFYAQSESVVRFLVKQKSKRNFIDFANDVAHFGIEKALQSHYFYRDTNELSEKWLSWVRDGMPDVKQEIYVGQC